MIFKKGDFVLVISAVSEHAGMIGTVKKGSRKTSKVIVNLLGIKKSIWIPESDIAKITQHQYNQLKKVGDNVSSVLSS